MQQTNEIQMRISYNKLWKLMIDKNIKKGQLQAAIGVSKGTMAKMGKNEKVSLSVLLSICEYLNCDFGDIIEAIPEDKCEASQIPYYLAYENRYQKVYAAGATCWGHSQDDEILIKALSKWVADNNLQGKRIIEYACGEGSCGIILSKLGCIYHGVDIAPTAVEKSKSVLNDFSYATVSQLDMVNEKVVGEYDAALDVMGYHMLVTDADRQKYLKNVYDSLKLGAHMLFFRESYRTDAYDGVVNSFAEWKIISGSDYETPEKRSVINNGHDIEVSIPLVPARARTKDGYIREITAAGFVIDDFVEMDINMQCPYSVSIYVHKM